MTTKTHKQNMAFLEDGALAFYTFIESGTQFIAFKGLDGGFVLVSEDGHHYGMWDCVVNFVKALKSKPDMAIGFVKLYAKNAEN